MPKGAVQRGLELVLFSQCLENCYARRQRCCKACQDGRYQERQRHRAA